MNSRQRRKDKAKFVKALAKLNQINLTMVYEDRKIIASIYIWAA